MLRNNNKGITLVALVITIIILLTLAGISISALTNQGLFANAKRAKEESENAEGEQSKKISEYEKILNEYSAEELTDTKTNVVLSETESTVLKDANGNIFTVPAGFKIVVNDNTGNANTVDKGIVIEDATETATKGSQFVWVPVGSITKADGTTVQIKLDRYTFGSDGKETTYSGNYIEEDTNDASTLKNYENKAVAKNITDFKNSVEKNGGYYIGRYEARTITARTSKDDALTQITEKGTDQIYNYVTQKQASNLARDMYNSSKFTSDLTNSYAWDTATLFLQSCGTNSKYSRQNSLNTSLSQIGTTNDIQCNVYDMASNIREWTTETTNVSTHPCAGRGGYYNISRDYTSVRNENGTSSSYATFGFRPILYVNV